MEYIELTEEGWDEQWDSDLESLGYVEPDDRFADDSALSDEDQAFLEKFLQQSDEEHSQNDLMREIERILGLITQGVSTNEIDVRQSISEYIPIDKLSTSNQAETAKTQASNQSDREPDHQRAVDDPEIIFMKLSTRYRSFLFTVALDIMMDYALAEEVVQETFLKVYWALKYNYSEQRRRELKTIGWLYTIVRNTAYKWYRKEKRFISVDPVEREELWKDDDEEFQRPDFVLLRNESHAELHELVKRLTPSQAAVINLRFFCDGNPNAEEPKYEEIACKLGLPLNTVKSHMRRGLHRLRKLLEEANRKQSMILNDA